MYFTVCPDINETIKILIYMPVSSYYAMRKSMHTEKKKLFNYCVSNYKNFHNCENAYTYIYISLSLFY